MVLRLCYIFSDYGFFFKNSVSERHLVRHWKAASHFLSTISFQTDGAERKVVSVDFTENT